MKSNIIITLFMLCWSMATASAQPNKAKATTARIEVQTFSKMDSIQVTDPAKAGILFVKPDQEGRFILDFELASPHEVELVGGKPRRWRTTLYLESGDNVSITVDTADNSKFSGTGSVKQEILYANQKRNAKFWQDTDFKNISANDLSTLVNRIADVSISYLSSNKDNVSTTFYQQEMINLQYGNKRMIFNVPSILKAYNSKRKMSTLIPDGYWELDKDIVQDDALLSNREYVLFMTNSYLNFLKNKLMFAQGKIDSTLSREKTGALFYELGEKNFKGELRRIALRSSLLIAFDAAKNIKEYKALLEKYLVQYANTEDREKMLASYNMHSKTNVGQVPPFFALKDLQGKEVTLKDFAGKVIYMDFWASWCSPCRYQMQNGSPVLHAKFKDNKDVVFLYVSIDDKADLWKKAVAEDKIEGIHVLSAGGVESEVAKAFNINGIPHYIIIGRDGKIFDNNAPRPSEDTTPVKINEALKAGV